MRVALLGPVLLAMTALVACDSAPTGAGAAAPASGRTAAVATVSPPGEVVPAADCGTFVLTQGKELPGGAVDCFVEAVRARRAARLAVTRPTTEGDPIPVTYASDGGGRVEVVTDSRQDNFGVRSVVRQICVGPTRFRGWLQFSDCSPPTTIGD